MSEAARFLTSLTHSLATMGLYGRGHPAREHVIDATYEALVQLQGRSARQVFTFMGTEVLHAERPLRELRSWEWGERLPAAGIQRLEIDERLTRAELEQFMIDLLGRLGGPRAEAEGDLSPRRGRVRVGAAGVRGLGTGRSTEQETVAGLGYTLQEELETIDWVHHEVEDNHELPLLEAEAVARSLTVAMHGDSHMVLPLLQVREHDEYTTTHCMNVAVLCMALAEFMGLGAAEVRAYGVAALLHDIGKVKVPREILSKPGPLTLEERLIVYRHPEDGARILLERPNMELAATVAYEHHRTYDGRGYPALRYPRRAHPASQMVHVCDVYDALRTHRPYRPAWTSAQLLDNIEERAGTDFDPDVAHAFTAMLDRWDVRLGSADEAEDDAAEEPVQAVA